jgi:predicted transcriptional regulator
MYSLEQRVFVWNTCAKHVYGKTVIESFLKDIVRYKCHVKEYIQIYGKILNRFSDG